MNFEDARVLVTGGTGSFGRHTADRLLAAGCREIRIPNRDEARQKAFWRGWPGTPFGASRTARSVF